MGPKPVAEATRQSLHAMSPFPLLCSSTLKSKDSGGNRQSGWLYPAGGREGVSGAHSKEWEHMQGRKRGKKKAKGYSICKYLRTSTLQT